MGSISLGTIMKAAVIAGLLAGLTAAVFHLVVTEPIIDRAIAVEEQRHAADGEHEQPVVTREVQKGGLVVGFVAYGLIWSVLFGIAYRIAQPWLPGNGRLRPRWLAALACYWAVALFPFLKYPANPPGVGDPETIAYRQALYLAFLGLSILGVAVAFALSRRDRAARAGRRWLAPAALAVFCLIVYLVMPANPDPIEMPPDVVATFRTLSLAGLTLFWVVMGFFFAVLLKGRSANGPRPA